MTWQLTLHCDHDVFADMLGEIADAVSIQPSDQKLWLTEAYFERKPDVVEIASQIAIAAEALQISEPEYQLVQLDNTDWLSKTYLDFPPIHAGRFYIYGSHVKTPVPASMTGVKIDAAIAFGSGEHATTLSCLRAIHDLKKHKKITRALDMGCGSGILALAIAKHSSARVIGVDNDAPSVQVAQKNAFENGLAAQVKFGYGNGFYAPLLRGAAKFDLIAANILARPLCTMAPKMKQNLQTGGTIILSGLLNNQENRVLATYRAQGLHLQKRYRINGWSALVLS